MQVQQVIYSTHVMLSFKIIITFDFDTAHGYGDYKEFAKLSHFIVENDIISKEIKESNMALWEEISEVVHKFMEEKACEVGRNKVVEEIERECFRVAK